LGFPAFALTLGASSVLASDMGTGASASLPDLIPLAEHADQRVYTELVREGRNNEAFLQAFEEGDELFETRFNAADGVGANVGDGLRFSRVPRADLDAPGEWATHVPARSTGPNAQACNSCHNQPMDDGAGLAANNVHRDPLHAGSMGSFITRNTPHLFGLGAVQLLAEEMTAELHALRDTAVEVSCESGEDVTRQLVTKGVDFGSLEVKASPDGACGAEIDTSMVAGVNPDLVVRPLHWKGKDVSIRMFNRDASHNELGMQAVELVGEGVDGDGDGVTDEMTVGDQTALVIYLAAQPRPVTRLELERIGEIEPMDAEERRSILDGEQHFADAGCAACHAPAMHLDDPVFREPSGSPHYRDELFANGLRPASFGLDPAHAISFDLTRDHPDNVIETGDGEMHRVGSFGTDGAGGAIVRLYSDLKRHDMGPALAETIDEIGVGESVWLTRSLWGVGSTAPYLHDGRATTLGEAILAHGGDSLESRAAFLALEEGEQSALIAFLDNLVLYKLEEEEEH